MTKQNNGEAETRKSFDAGQGITFPNAEEAIKWLKSGAEQDLIEKNGLLERPVLMALVKDAFIGKPPNEAYGLAGDITKAQLNKVLSMLEPVKLEALGDEEIEVIAKERTPFYVWGKAEWGNILHAIEIGSQVTIHKNQKGQLFRVKE